MKQKKNNSSSAEWLLGLIFFLVGVGIMCIGVAVHISDQKFKETAKTTPATITEIERYTTGTGSKRKTHHRVYVTYEVDGKRYEDVRLGTYTSGMYEGKVIDLYYDEDEPGNVRYISNFPTVLVIMLFMGGIFALVGGSLLVYTIKKSLKRKRLLQNGKPLSAIMEDMIVVTTRKTNGVHPRQLICYYDDVFSGNRYLFRSEDYYGHDDFYMGGTVTVYVNPTNYQDYFVDLSTAQSQYEATGEGLRVVDFT